MTVNTVVNTPFFVEMSSAGGFGAAFAGVFGSLSMWTSWEAPLLKAEE